MHELGVEPPSGFAEGFDVHNTASESLRMPVVIAVSNILPVPYIHAHAGEWARLGKHVADGYSVPVDVIIATLAQPGVQAAGEKAEHTVEDGNID
ncbi:g3286 [Coccomyxa elongata]